MTLEKRSPKYEPYQPAGAITAQCGVLGAAAGAVNHGAKGALIGGVAGLLLGAILERVIE